MNPEFIVAEVSKNWFEDEAEANERAAAARDAIRLDLLNRRFERVIEVNRQRGYRLHSWTLHRLYLSGPRPHINETIIAVFQCAGSGAGTT